MITVTAKFLGGIQRDLGFNQATASFDHGAGLAELITWLGSLGIDTDAPDILITLDGQGVRQLPQDFRLEADGTVAVFPMISGG